MTLNPKSNVYFIAEAGVNHNGDIETALKMVKVAKECGADAVKFQTFKTELNVSKHAKLANYQEKSKVEVDNQLEMLKQLELGREDFQRIKAYCDKLNVHFISTPDDQWSVDFLVELKAAFIKIASAEMDNVPFLKMIGRTGKPVILSTGMSTLDEVELAVDTLQKAGAKTLALLHCTSNYPTEPAYVNLKAMVTLADTFKLKVGFSDHTLGCEAAVAAVALGAEIIEKHFTLDKNLPGPDQQASADPSELNTCIQMVRKVEMMLGDGIKRPQPTEMRMIPSMRRSLVASRGLRKGEILKPEMIQFKRPGTGISPAFLESILGMELLTDLEEDDILFWECLQ